MSTETIDDATSAVMEKTKRVRAKAAKKATKASAKKAAGTVDRSAAIAETWRNKKVAAARSLKHKVKVGGEIYNSVKAAFEALKLPLGQHIRFRGELKAAPNGASFDGRKFTLVKHA